MREKCKCYEVSLHHHHHLLLLNPTAAIIEVQKVNKLCAEIILAPSSLFSDFCDFCQKKYKNRDVHPFLTGNFSCK